MKILLTGGHFAPALAVIEKLKDEEIVVVGRKTSHEGDTGDSFEYKICKERGIPFRTIRTGRLQRVLTSQTVPSLLRFPVGVVDALRLLRQEKPDVVVVFGGYIALPVAIAAKMLSIPVVLHEQVLHAGVTTKAIDRLARVVCISFESSRKYFKNKNIVLTGNPIRSDLLESVKPVVDGPDRIIYITGGSSGSHAINKAIKDILPSLLEECVVVHQAGGSTVFNDYEKLEEYRKALPQELQKNYILKPFFDTSEVGWLLKNSQLVVSRAGINTVTEFIALGVVGILIPIPYGQRNEQLENAKYYKGAGLGEYLRQDDLSPQLLLSTIRAMIKKRSEYKKNAQKEKLEQALDATNLIIGQIKKYGRRNAGEAPKTS